MHPFYCLSSLRMTHTFPQGKVREARTNSRPYLEPFVRIVTEEVWGVRYLLNESRFLEWTEKEHLLVYLDLVLKGFEGYN